MRIVLVVAAVLSGGFVAAAYVVAWMLIPMAGTEHGLAGKALADRRGLALVAGFWSVLIVVRILASVFKAGWLGSLVFPLAIVGGGTDPDLAQRHRGRAGDDPPPGPSRCSA